MSKYGNNDKVCADEYKHDDVSQWTTSERLLNIHEAARVANDRLKMAGYKKSIYYHTLGFIFDETC